MARLYRPHVPLAVKVAVAERQLREIEDRRNVRYPRSAQSDPLAHRLAFLLDGLAWALCNGEVAELRLDHDPPLALRPFNEAARYYYPDANDPEYLLYRPHGAQHAGSHDVKTRVRGDHGQHSDLALIRIKKRRERPKPKRGRKIGSPGFYGKDTKPRSAWPPRGSRKIPSRKSREKSR